MVLGIQSNIELVSLLNSFSLQPFFSSFFALFCSKVEISRILLLFKVEVSCYSVNTGYEEFWILGQHWIYYKLKIRLDSVSVLPVPGNIFSSCFQQQRKQRHHLVNTWRCSLQVHITDGVVSSPVGLLSLPLWFPLSLIVWRCSLLRRSSREAGPWGNYWPHCASSQWTVVPGCILKKENTQQE